MAKRKNKEVIQDKKRAQLIERTARILNVEASSAERLLCQTLRPSVRLNPLVGDPKETLLKMKALGWKGEAISWCDTSYSIGEGFEVLRDSDLVTSGGIYLQNEASWVPIIALNPQPGEVILDVCAAPGGKTSHIAALMRNTGRLVANDNSRPRLMKLRQNLTRLHATAEYTLHDGTRLSKVFPKPIFDKILLDAPCSGEGLINLAQPKTLDSWSVAHIRRLSGLQKQLITEAWKLLKPGGKLVYSTCTMAPEENEVVVNYLLKRHDNAMVVPITLPLEHTTSGLTAWNDRFFDQSLKYTLRLLPKNGREAFFASVIEKEDI